MTTTTKTDATDALARTFGVERRAAEEPIWWLLERSGEHRAVWGPYTLGQAVAQKGTRHLIVRGSGLRPGETLTSGEVQAAAASGRIWPAEPDVRAIS
jgi:hypothetical protein